MTNITDTKRGWQVGNMTLQWEHSVAQADRHATRTPEIGVTTCAQADRHPISTPEIGVRTWALADRHATRT